MEEVQRAGSRRSQSYKRRLLSYVLCFVLVLGLIQPPPAKASVSISGSLIASVAATYLAASGYTWVCDQMDASGFQDVVQRELQDFLDSVHDGIDLISWVPSYAIEANGSGSFLLSKDFVTRLTEFSAWFQSKYGLDNASSSVISSSPGGIALADGSVFALSTWDGNSSHEPSFVGTCLTGDTTITFSSGYTLRVVCVDGNSWGYIYFRNPSGQSVFTSSVYSLRAVYLVLNGSEYCLLVYVQISPERCEDFVSDGVSISV